MKNTFGENLKRLRIEKGLTQEQVASSLSISYQAVSKWENGVANPDLSLIVPLARLLSVSTDTLLCMNDDFSEKAKKKYLDALKSSTNWSLEGRQKRLEIAKRMITELPEDVDANYHYAQCLEDYIEYDAKDNEKETLLIECEKSYQLVLDNLPENNNGKG